MADQLFFSPQINNFFLLRSLSLFIQCYLYFYNFVKINRLSPHEIITKNKMDVLFDMYTVLTKWFYLYNTHCILFVFWLFVTRVWLCCPTDRDMQIQWLWRRGMPEHTLFPNEAKIYLFFFSSEKNLTPPPFFLVNRYNSQSERSDIFISLHGGTFK